MWNGQKKLLDAVGQLLRYTAWRDTKAALILFIQGGPSEIIKKADEALRGHITFRSAAPSTEPDLRQDYLLVDTSRDQYRSVRLAFLPVIIPSPSSHNG
ncbi:hypothetical protein Aple_003780 [Acrocarpospora pleiomorpha]|uniref:Uncharacterized protein n=1 Tax=Acrocarpospora pleiomorpha TaxID=90975 RepID=A0A5M3XEV8_9ACTN|nr:hypothetical protein Aple_003780 [Acrocarpospora pleiomorpha]